MIPRIFMGNALRAGGGWSSDWLIADCEDIENPTKTSTKKSNTKEICRFQVQTDLSLSSTFLGIHRGDRAGMGNCEQDLKKLHRSPLDVPNEDTFSVPLRYVDVRRQTRTSIDNASEHTLNDYWNAESEKLSEEWIATRRFQTFRMQLQKEYRWVNGRHTSPKFCTTSYDVVRRKANTNKEKRSGSIFDVHPKI